MHFLNIGKNLLQPLSLFYKITHNKCRHIYCSSCTYILTSELGLGLTTFQKIHIPMQKCQVPRFCIILFRICMFNFMSIQGCFVCFLNFIFSSLTILVIVYSGKKFKKRFILNPFIR